MTDPPTPQNPPSDDDEGISLLRQLNQTMTQIRDRLAGGEMVVHPSPAEPTEPSSTPATPTPEPTSSDPTLLTPAAQTNVRVADPTVATVEEPPTPQRPKMPLPWGRKHSM